MKLVKEHIVFEKFEEETDPIRDLGIGDPVLFENAFHDFIYESFLGYWSHLNELTILLPNKIRIVVGHPPYKDNFSMSRRTALGKSGFYKFSSITDIDKKGTFSDYYSYRINEEYTYLLPMIDEFKYKKIFFPGRDFKGERMGTYEVKIIWKSDKVKESLNEKFSEDSDPIKNIGIGVNVPMNFTRVKDFADYLVATIPYILNTSEIPKDILKQAGTNINSKYYLIIENYILKYITFKHMSPKTSKCKIYFWPEILRKRLGTLGFEKYEYR